MGQTRDDAVGEAYDKVAKMLGLGYPGGNVIDRLATEGDPDKIKFPRPFLDKQGFDFSFSGIKTAVNRYISKNENVRNHQAPDIAAGFQAAVVDVLTFKVLNAALQKGCDHIAVVGGVAANNGLRKRILQDAVEKNIQVHIPSPTLCGDNAAMIAATGYHYLKAGIVSTMDMDVYSRVNQK